VQGPGRLEVVELLGAAPHHDVLAWPTMSSTSPTASGCSRYAGMGADLVINAAAFTAVDACEEKVDEAFAVNALGPRNLAEGARYAGAHLVQIRPITSLTASLPCLTSNGTGRGRCRFMAARNWVARPRSFPWPSGPRWCARRGCAGATAPTWSRPSCAWPARDAPAFRRRPERVPDLCRRPRRHGRATRHIPPAGRFPCHQPRPYLLVRLCPGRPGGGGPVPDQVEPIKTADLVPPRPAPAGQLRARQRRPAPAGRPAIADYHEHWNAR